MTDQSPAKLRLDILLTLTLLTIAKAGRQGKASPEVCFYLGDRYIRLAEYHRQKGAPRKAKRLRAKAESYFQGSGPWRDPPSAAAMAMPVPKRPTLTEAIGWNPRKGPPDAA